ncbi:hypothetical protein HAX54_031566 [Datura stramonium]|uniref:Uncharacterized protein n=1 Tax=Datura stramonium TaxID=4076 RepID=A0ABS8RL76_DATST|nr:hypothetical protein [Datura stramonium]
MPFLDQFTPCSYIPVILFYNANDVVDQLKSMVAKKSLAEALSYYYPVAGRFKNAHSIECSHEGVVYMEAQANFNLAKFLENPDIPSLNKFLPCKGNCPEPSYQPLLALQTTTFECGGMAISVCMLHKPVWVAHMGDLPAAPVRSKQQFVFLESACREGIELWVASDDEEIKVMEKHPEFLAYANQNPSICTN